MKVAIIGGDKRMLFAAKAFSESGTEVMIAGFENLKSLCDILVSDYETALKWADYVVLPIRPVTEGCIAAPNAKTKLTVTDFSRLIGEKPVFCGFNETINSTVKGSVYCYSTREEFAVQNAVLTAEGAIEMILRFYENSLNGANVLILGYGRIGKVLARYLSAFGAEVTVAARKPRDRAWIKAFGMNTCDYSLKELSEYQIIINTVPAMVLDHKQIDRLCDDVFIIDLASAPGGVDFQRAKERDLTCIHALALPGKIAPAAAGRIIKDTIFNIIKEENGGKDNFGLRDDRLLLHL
ncbi:MAG: dipicolinate synthase subunit DpsA [Ruminococcus sp.]|nr:dipicolinate synthase subunit DpsA [Ruminococcus sp.]